MAVLLITTVDHAAAFSFHNFVWLIRLTRRKTKNWGLSLASRVIPLSSSSRMEWPRFELNWLWSCKFILVKNIWTSKKASCDSVSTGTGNRERRLYSGPTTKGAAELVRTARNILNVFTRHISLMYTRSVKWLFLNNQNTPYFIWSDVHSGSPM